MDKETSSKQWWKITRGQMGTGKTSGVDALIDNNILIVDDTENL